MRGYALTPVLSHKEQLVLAAEYRRSKCPITFNKLMESNLRLVIKIAREYNGRRMIQLDDLIQEGALGLAVAIERFDPEIGSNIGTYAAPWIRGYITKWISQNNSLLGTKKGVNVVCMNDYLINTLPSNEKALDLLLANREDMRALVAGLCEVVPKLKKRDKEIFEARLLAEVPASLQHIADTYGVSRERIRQIEVRLIDKLRTIITTKE